MLCSLFQVLTFLIFLSTTAQASRRSLHSSIRARKDWSVFNNASSGTDDQVGLVKRDGGKYVFMHHVRLNFVSSLLSGPDANFFS